MSNKMLYIAAIIAVLLSVSAVAGELTNCNQNSYTYLGQASPQTWNCMNSPSPTTGLSTVFGMTAPNPIMFFFNPATSLVSPYYYIKVQCDAQPVLQFTGTPSAEPFVVGPCKSLNVTFFTQYIGYDYSFELSWTTEYLTPLMPGVPNTYTAAASPHGSLVSYSFNEMAGSHFYVNASVTNYDGFVAPQLIAGTGFIPIPGEQSSEVTFSSDGGLSYQASLNFQIPSGSFYGFGIELFGGVNDAQVELTPHWTYSFASLGNGQHVSATGPNYYQAAVGTSSQITIQLARTNVGGYPVVAVHAGSPISGPTVTTLTTSPSQNYDSITIDNPWNGSGSAPNPGLLILVVTCENGQSNCGFTTAVSW